jgi:ribosome maturation factor RimP
MLSPEALEKIKSLADEVCLRESCIFYDLEFSGGHQNRILRVFIDTESGAVSVEQCANVSRGLSLLLDVQDIIPGGAYELEVSSPGIERILRLPWHYKTAIGKEVKVITFESVPGLKGEVKSLTGQLISAQDDSATLKYADSEVVIPFTNIKKAQTVFVTTKGTNKR